MARPERFDFTKQPGHLLRKALQRNQAIYGKHCVDPNMTSVQFAVLYAITDMGPCSMAMIGRTAAIDAATTRGVVERLAARGLVSLSPDLEDKRKVVVRIETAGARLVRKMMPKSREIGELTLEGLNPGERFAFLYLLEKVANGPGGEEPDGDIAE